MSKATLVTFLLCLLLINRRSFANAQALGTIYTTGGPTIIVQDPISGQFMYNVYSTNGYGPMRSVALKATPKNGTAFGVAGWGNPGSSVYVSRSP